MRRVGGQTAPLLRVGMGDMDTDFDLQAFLPYLLNQAAEASSRDFQSIYRSRFGMTRTQWRILAHLGRFGAMTARDICRRSQIEKTKVSRSITALEARGWLQRAPSPVDRRSELLELTAAGRAGFAEVGQHALAYDQALRAELGEAAAGQLVAILRRLIARRDDPPSAD